MRLSFKPNEAVHSAAWLIVVASLASCKDKEVEPPVLGSAAPSSVAKSPGCADGISDDPPRGEFRPAVGALHDKKYGAAQKLLRNLCEKYPNSATARVWLGDAFLYDTSKDYLKSADAALEQYGEARRLIEQGCQLRDAMSYYLTMGTAYAHLRKDQSELAQQQLQLAEQSWPDSAEVYYHQARALCLKQQFPACLERLERTLQLAKERRRPLFLRVHRSLDDWLERAERQSEFEALREQQATQYAALRRRYRSDALLPP